MARLTEAITRSVAEALARTSDRVIRVETPANWPISEALGTLVKSAGPIYVGLLRPFRLTTVEDLRSTGSQVSDKPSIITSWRNDQSRSQPLIICGYASGQGTAGLRDFAVIVKAPACLKMWQEMDSGELATRLNTVEVNSYVAELYRLAQERVIDALNLDEYLHLVETTGTLECLYSEMWMLGLVPDDQTLDSKAASKRLSINRETVAALESDDREVRSRLLEIRAQGGEAARSAIAALEFWRTGEKSALRGASLRHLLSVPTSRKDKERRTPSGDLMDMLDLASSDPQIVVNALSQLDEEWKVTNSEANAATVEVPVENGDGESSDKRTYTISLNPERTDTVFDDGDAPTSEFVRTWAGESQVLFAISESVTPKPFDGEEGWLGQIVTPEQLIQLAEWLSEPARTLLIGALREYASARSALGVYEPWLHQNALDLLLVKSDARTAVSSFLEAWRNLLSTLDNVPPLDSAGTYFQMLEATWGPDRQTPQWAVLGPLHPYRLEPLLRLACELTDALMNGDNKRNYGQSADWLRDRCIPSYPVIYHGREVLYLSRSGEQLIYVREAASRLPSASEGTGLSTVFRALRGFSPHLNRGAVLTVVDAPSGKAVNRDLTVIANGIGGNLTVCVAATRPDAIALSESDIDNRFIGNFNSLRQFAESYRAPTNILVVFSAQPSGYAAASIQGWQATSGTFVAPQLDVRFDPIAGPDEDAIKVKVLVQPRGANTSVHSLQQLYRKLNASEPLHFEYRPLLSKADVQAVRTLSQRADWVILAVPGPMGLAVPTSINNVLNYVGRDNFGPYGLYVYSADDLFSVRRHIDQFLSHLPVIPVEHLSVRLASHARESGNSILRMGIDGVAEHQAELVALNVATETNESQKDKYIDLVLRVDDLGWTRIWIGTGLRCDYLVVRVARDKEVHPRVIIRAVESKSVSHSDPLEVVATSKPFDEGIRQVLTTLRSIISIVSTDGNSLETEVRFASFVEHLMASTLASGLAMDNLKLLQDIRDTLNALAARQLQESDIVFEGYVVTTQAATNAPRQSVRILQGADEIPVHLVKATATDVSVIFGPDDSVGNSLLTDEYSHVVDTEVEAELSSEGENIEDSDTVSAYSDNHTDSVGEKVGDWAEQVGGDLIKVCRKHNISALGDAPVRIVVGPSLAAFSVRLRAGSQLAQIDRRIDDIMRDLGIGDIAKEVTVENDSEPSTVRFIIPRPERHFPSLPSQRIPANMQGGYLPIFIGQTLDGKDYCSSVESWPHLLVAGTTGSGKTTLLRSLLSQFGQYGPDKLQLVVVDGKGDMDYEGVLPAGMFEPSFPEVLYGHDRVPDVLQYALTEMDHRRDLLRSIGAQQNTSAPLKWGDLYRDALASGKEPHIRPLVILIDEFADIMLASKSSSDAFLKAVQRIAQVGRSRLVHLVLATQRPDRETIKGAIKANFDARAVLRLPTAADSLTILGHGGAERLLRHGDMLFRAGGSEVRLQGYRS